MKNDIQKALRGGGRGSWWSVGGFLALCWRWLRHALELRQNFVKMAVASCVRACVGEG